MQDIKTKRFHDYLGELTVTYRRTNELTRKLNCSSDAVDIIRPYFDECMDDHESAKLLLLNNANYVTNISHLSNGSSVGTIIPITKILKLALISGCTSILLVHNHPSGNKKASQQDIRISKRLQEACKLIDITLLDSIIITRESYLSLKDECLI